MQKEVRVEREEFWYPFVSPNKERRGSSLTGTVGGG